MGMMGATNGWKNNGWWWKRKADPTRCNCDDTKCQAHKGTWCKIDGEHWVTHPTKDYKRFWAYPTRICQFCLPFWQVQGFLVCKSGLVRPGQIPELLPMLESGAKDTNVAKITPQCSENNTLSPGTEIVASKKSRGYRKKVSGT